MSQHRAAQVRDRSTFEAAIVMPRDPFGVTAGHKLDDAALGMRKPRADVLAIFAGLWHESAGFLASGDGVGD